MAFHETNVRFDVLSNIWRAVSGWPSCELWICLQRLCWGEGDSVEGSVGLYRINGKLFFHWRCFQVFENEDFLYGLNMVLTILNSFLNPYVYELTWFYPFFKSQNTTWADLDV